MEQKSNFEVAYNAMESVFASYRTRSERKRLGYSVFPEFNVGAWFDDRNPAWAQPDHHIWRGNDQWGLRAPVLDKYMRKLNMIEN